MLSVLMPVYNEAATLEEILRRVLAVPVEKEIIVVDNISTDGTRAILEGLISRGEAVWADGEPGSARVRVAYQTVNHGKGASVRRALALARGEWIVVQDADLEYDPMDYLKLLALTERKPRCQAVFGTRLVKGSATRQAQPRTAFYYGRVGLSLLFRLLYGMPVSDVATCYKLMRRSLAQSLNLKANGFDLDFEIAARLARRRVRIHEVPISYAPRTVLEGKKIHALRDGLRAAWTLWKYRFVL